MASAEKIAQRRVDTLPADFNEWDNAEAPSILPDNFSDFDPATDSGPVAVSPTTQKLPDVATWPVVDTSANANSNHTKEDRVKGKNRVVAQSVIDEDNSERDSEKKSHIYLIAMIATASVVVLLCAVFVGMHFMSSNKPAKPNPTITRISQMPNPSVEMPVTDSATNVAKPSPATPATAPTPVLVNAPPPSVDSEFMNKQLSAPTRISGDMRRPTQQEAPPSAGFNAAGMESFGGSGVGSAFGKRNAPVVKVEVPKKINVPKSAVMAMLQHVTTPEYPTLAKTAHVEGTVDMHVIISKNGTIESVRPISGASLLQQAAVNAVKNWRFRQYTIDNQPVEVESTVSVVFKLSK